MIINQQIIIIIITINLITVIKTIIFHHQERQILFVASAIKKATKLSNAKIKGEKIFVRI